MLQNHRFGDAICVAVVRNSIALCHSVSADRSGMAAPRFLAAVAACVVLLCFAAGRRKSQCNGCLKVGSGALGGDLFFIRC